ncbi:CMRF35-like molecule 8 [Puntigrus tetrazona]|uniref:CMRF35-like molecule 8 n=1 Tax=Puntigrus tetrazona TaxID=1606681 RepID=UPI001C892A17|nr:CMRF35-like molecule 8 [Puntigrus tetrazona]
MWKARVICFCFYAASVMDSSCAIIVYEGKYVTFKATYSPSYESNVKYFGRTDGFLYFEKLVETSRPNQWVKKGRFALFDNSSTHVLTATIMGLISEDSGSYLFGVDIKLLPDLTGEEIQLTVIRGEDQRTTTPAKVTVYSTSVPAEITTQNRAKTRDQESHARFVTVLSLVCVCTLLVVSSFVLFKVKNWPTTCKLPVSVSYHTRKTSTQVVDEYVKMNSVDLINSPTTQSDKGSAFEDFRRPTNTDACNTDLAQTDLDQIYTKMKPELAQESIYQSID